MSINSDEINYLVYRYIQESGTCGNNSLSNSRKIAFPKDDADSLRAPLCTHRQARGVIQPMALCLLERTSPPLYRCDGVPEPTPPYSRYCTERRYY